MNQEEILSEILKVEEQTGVNDLYIEGIPIWAIIKYRLRGYHNVELGIDDITNQTKRPKKKFFERIKDIYNSFFDIYGLYKTKTNIPYCFVGFTRLEKINSVYIDKFIDPVITQCELDKKDYIYINNEKSHPAERSKEHSIVFTDFIEYLSIFLLPVVFPILYIRNRKTYKILKTIIKNYFTKNKKAIVYLYVKPTLIYIQQIVYKSIFGRLGIKSVIGVARPSFFSQTLAAKKIGIKVIELQHGITHGLTNLYSGVYNTKIDPDYFCTFGEACSLDVFNIPESKIVNIGFALNSYLKKIVENNKYENNYILVISEPEPSENILTVVLKLANMYPELEFHIRRHPQEVYSDTQKERIKLARNVKDVSSSECSQVAIMPYTYIIGDNSSVLFEAVSIGKKVARLNCEGLISYGYDPEEQDGFFYLNNLNDFTSFINSNHKKKDNRMIYSDFDSHAFKCLISK